jgi:hypothetical protein
LQADIRVKDIDFTAANVGWVVDLGVALTGGGLRDCQSTSHEAEESDVLD